MINFPILRAVLAASAAAALSLPAAAQTDAAFASALGKIPSGLAAMASLKTKPQKPAAVQGPIAPADIWQEVLDTALYSGKSKPLPNTPLVSYMIEENFIDPKVDYARIQSVNVLILPASDEGYRVWAAQFVVIENTYVPERRHARLDSWVFETDGSGRLQSALHITDIVVSETEKTKGTPEKLDLADPKTKARYDAMLEHWARR